MMGDLRKGSLNLNAISVDQRKKNDATKLLPIKQHVVEGLKIITAYLHVPQRFFTGYKRVYSCP